MPATAPENFTARTFGKILTAWRGSINFCVMALWLALVWADQHAERQENDTDYTAI